MINCRVDDLGRMLAQLRALGDQVEARVEYSALGLFGRVMDPNGITPERGPPAPEPTV
ncbi:MAG: hypothetical protein ABJC74_07305 [Gemmatimonadota bacterium]